MGFFANRKARRQERQGEQIRRQMREARLNAVPDNTSSVAMFSALHPGAYIDPTVQQDEVDREFDERAQTADEISANLLREFAGTPPFTGGDEPAPSEDPTKPDDAPVVVDEPLAQENYSAGSHGATQDNVTEVYQPSYDSGSSSSYDSGSSYSDSGSSYSSSDSGSSCSDSGSSYSDSGSF